MGGAGLILAALQIARAIRAQDQRHGVRAALRHVGGALIALTADEIVMCQHAALGPIDLQVGQSPAASLLEIVEQKPAAEMDDQALVLADVGRKAIEQVKSAARARARSF